MQDKAQKLHEQLHGSTFHVKLAKEAMKKVREAEAAVQAKMAEEAEALKQGVKLCLRFWLSWLGLFIVTIAKGWCLASGSLYSLNEKSSCNPMQVFSSSS